MKKNSHKKTVEKPSLECRLAFRLSAKEKQEIEAKAKLCAMSPSKYIRRLEKSEYAVTSLKLNEMPKTN